MPRVPRRKRLTQRETTDIATWFSNKQLELGITTNLLKCSKEHTDTGSKAYKQLYAKIASYRNEHNQTVFDLFVDDSAHAIVAESIRRMQVFTKIPERPQGIK